MDTGHFMIIPSDTRVGGVDEAFVTPQLLTIFLKKFVYEISECMAMIPLSIIYVYYVASFNNIHFNRP